MPTETEREAEMVMHAFRLMRSGNYQSARALERAIREDFPDASDDEIKACMKKLGDIAVRMS